MAITENLLGFLNDFGVSCTAGAVTGLGILDMPSQIIANDMEYRIVVIPVETVDMLIDE